MRQLFRSFSWAALLPILAFALVLRGWGSYAVLPGPSTAHVTLGAWGAWLRGGLSAAAPFSGLLSAVPAVLVGFIAAASLQDYRLADAGTLPAYLSALLASAAGAWLSYDGAYLAALALAAAAHQLYGAYRQQGASLPVYNAGFYLGLAGLLSAPAFWMVGWAALALFDLRKFRGGDFLGLAFGALTLPGLYLAYAYVFGDFAAARDGLLAGAAALPTAGGFRQNLPHFAVLAAATLLVLLAAGALVGRRPVPEQRAHRMYYTMLPFAWVATVLGQGAAAAPPTTAELSVQSVPALETAVTPAFLLLPLSLLLGVYLTEAPRKPANAFLAAATLGVIGVIVYGALAH